MSRRNAFLFKIIVFLFALNCFSLYVYLHRYGNPKVHLHDHQQPQQQIQKHHQLPVSVLNIHAKPWPILPSYLPWSSDPNVPPYSCEGYFGNGFNRRIELLLPSPVISRGSLPSDGVRGGQGGWFRCFYSQSLESSICEGGRIRMNPDRIRMSVGGENLKSVIGRDEKQELPSFDSGAFEVEFAQGLNRSENVNGGKLVNQEFLYHLVPKGTVTFHTMRALLDSMRLVDAEEFRCSEWVEEPTLLVTRFEYANLFHTVTDWYSAYVASRVTGMPNRPHLVFLDGHCKTQLEETWKALFTSLRYSKNFSGPVCFRHAVLSPLGYETALFKGLKDPPIDCQGATAHDLRQNPNDRKTARLSEFGEMIQAAFGFPVIRNQCPELVSGHNVLFVRREDYLAHPRHAGKVESRLTNEEEVFEALKSWAFNHLKCKVNLVNGLFAHMPMKEQVRAIRDASVIIGAHGAGLTHVIAASPNAVVLEIVSYDFRRPHFKLISRWRGLKYYAIYLDESRADPKVVIKTVSSIINSLGC